MRDEDVDAVAATAAIFSMSCIYADIRIEDLRMVAAAAIDANGRRSSAARWELYRLLSEPIRLRLLALAAAEELSVGELTELLGEGQPNVSRHASVLRQAGLLSERKEGTRVLVRLVEGAANDPVVADALSAGRALCENDGSLRRVPRVVRARDAASRAFFAKKQDEDVVALPPEIGTYLAALAPLVPQRRLAVDAGTGDGGLLEVLARVFHRVVAFDREDRQLRRAASRISRRGLSNVELVRGEVGSADVRKLVHARGGADAVFASRILHHAPKPALVVETLADLVAPGGALVVLDYAKHDDEAMRAQADLWLGFEPFELRRFALAAGLDDVHVTELPPFGDAHAHATPPDAHLPWQVMIARRAQNSGKKTSKTPRRKP